MTETTPHAEMEPLAPLIGDWEVEARFPGADASETGGWATFEWLLGGRFMVQRSGADHPAAPDGFCVIAPDGDGGFRQHYFDSRGVVRLYAMTFGDGEWTLLREQADFTPLSFRQRFLGRFEDGGDTIQGRFETDEGDGWRLDFEIVYRRVTRT